MASCKCSPTPTSQILCCISRQTTQILFNQAVIDQTTVATRESVLAEYGPPNPQIFQLENPVDITTVFGEGIARLQTAKGPRGNIEIRGSFYDLGGNAANVFLRSGSTVGDEVYTLAIEPTNAGPTAGQFTGNWIVPNATLLEDARTSNIFIVITAVDDTILAQGVLILSEAPLVFQSIRGDDVTSVAACDPCQRRLI